MVKKKKNGRMTYLASLSGARRQYSVFSTCTTLNSLGGGLGDSWFLLRASAQPVLSFEVDIGPISSWWCGAAGAVRGLEPWYQRLAD